MKPKDKKAFIVYLLLSLITWQFVISLTEILKLPQFKIEDNLVFSIIETTNKGAAFGIFGDSSFILGIFGLVILFTIAFLLYKQVGFDEKIKILTSSMFSAGILGNTYERLVNGYVFDFIKLNFIEFPVFNLFDILITISVFLYIIFYIKEELTKRIKA